MDTPNQTPLPKPKYLMLDHGGVLDGSMEALSKPLNADDLVLCSNDGYGYRRALRNGFQIIQNLNELVDNHGYQIVFHSANTFDDQDRIWKEIRAACSARGITSPRITATVVYTNQAEILPSKPLSIECYGDKLDGVVKLTISGKLAGKGKAGIRQALSAYFKIRSEERSHHIVFDDGGSVIDTANQEGYRTFLIGDVGHAGDACSLHQAVQTVLQESQQLRPTTKRLRDEPKPTGKILRDQTEPDGYLNDERKKRTAYDPKSKYDDSVLAFLACLEEYWRSDPSINSADQADKAGHYQKIANLTLDLIEAVEPFEERNRKVSGIDQNTINEATRAIAVFKNGLLELPLGEKLVTAGYILVPAAIGIIIGFLGGAFLGAGIQSPENVISSIVGLFASDSGIQLGASLGGVISALALGALCATTGKVSYSPPLSNIQIKSQDLATEAENVVSISPRPM